MTHAHPVSTAKQAEEVVQLYRLRWRIEQVFRAMKSDGLRLEETQVQEAARLFKIAAIALVAAARTIQFVDARDGGPRPASDVADDVRAHFGASVLSTIIPRSVRVSEAPSRGQSVISYDPASSGAIAYTEAAHELALQSVGAR